MSDAIERRTRTDSAEGVPSLVMVQRVVHSSSTARTTSDRMKVLVVNSGTTTILHQTGELNLGEGQVVLLPPGQWYAGVPAGQVVTTTACIDTEFLHEQVRWIPKSSASALLLSSKAGQSDPILIDLPSQALSHLNASFRLLLDSHQNEAPALHQLSRIAELFDILTRPTTEHDPGNTAVRQAVSRLLEQLDYPWSIDVLAASVSISRSQLSRLFRQHLQMSPAEFLRTERAKRMAELLVSDPRPIDAIARQVGWYDSSHASRVFRHAHGLSPQLYRRTHGAPQGH
ncbi:MAG: helix-turn-helix domain-containing protein [Canibacter sp.]